LISKVQEKWPQINIMAGMIKKKNNGLRNSTKQCNNLIKISKHGWTNTELLNKILKRIRNPRELNPNQWKNPIKLKDVLERVKEKKVEINLKLNKKSPRERVKRNKNQHLSQKRNLARKERALKNK